MSPFEAYQNKERELLNRALQIVGPVHPAYNLAPVLDLIRQADALGFDVIPRNHALASQQQQFDPSYVAKSARGEASF